MQKKGWLGDRITEAQKEIEKWPEWMKAASRFEGAQADDAGEPPVRMKSHGTRRAEVNGASVKPSRKRP